MWLVALQVTKQVLKNSFISYILPQQVWWHNIKQFLSYSKKDICKFIQANSWHNKLFHFHLFFWIWKVWKGKKLQKFEYLKNEKSFLDEVKNIFHSFWWAIIWWKNKNLLKIANTSFNIFRENEKFATNIYRKKTFSWIYTNFKGCIPEAYKIGLIKRLLRCFSLCSDFYLISSWD